MVHPPKVTRSPKELGNMYFRQFVNALGIFLLLFLPACGAKPGNPSPFPDATPEVTSTPAYDSVLGSYQVSLPIKSLEHLSQEEIAARLFTLWLDHFQSEAVDYRIRLQDFKIQEVILIPEFQSCAKDIGTEFIPTVRYSVLPFHIPAPDWDAGSGTSGEDHWIVDKLAEMGIFKTGDAYTFRRLGEPPCSK